MHAIQGLSFSRLDQARGVAGTCRKEASLIIGCITCAATRGDFASHLRNHPMGFVTRLVSKNRVDQSSLHHDDFREKPGRGRATGAKGQKSEHRSRTTSDLHGLRECTLFGFLAFLFFCPSPDRNPIATLETTNDLHNFFTQRTQSVRVESHTERVSAARAHLRQAR
jgi:hypothetical protein